MTSTCLSFGAAADYGWVLDQPREITQVSISEWSNNRVVLLKQCLAVSMFGHVHGRGETYCSQCGTITSSLLTPDLLRECQVCKLVEPVKSKLRYWSHWSFWRFAENESCANAIGRTYLFSVPDTVRNYKFGFSYDPKSRARNSPLYGDLVWQSPVTTRAIARTVELDLFMSVQSNLFNQTDLTPVQAQQSGASEVFKLHRSWSLDQIITHLNNTFLQVEKMGWKDYWLTFLPGADGAPKTKLDTF